MNYHWSELQKFYTSDHRMNSVTLLFHARLLLNPTKTWVWYKYSVHNFLYYCNSVQPVTLGYHPKKIIFPLSKLWWNAMFLSMLSSYECFTPCFEGYVRFWNKIEYYTEMLCIILQLQGKFIHLNIIMWWIDLNSTKSASY